MNTKNIIYKIKNNYHFLKLMKIYHKLFKGFSNREVTLPEFYNFNIHRHEIIQKIIDTKKFKTYLEIGCDENELFSKVKIEKKIGVDPNSGGTHRMNSDEFYEQNNEKFDLIFIDGLHDHRQVKKDIINSLDILNKKGFILLHDCFPLKYFDQALPRAQKHWNGDVWRSILECRTYKNINTFVGAFDNGIGLIFKKKNDAPLRINLNTFSNISFDDYCDNYKTFLNLIDYNEFFIKIDNAHN
jgi:hypothetical protein